MYWKDDLKERYEKFYELSQYRNRKLFEKEFPGVKDHPCWGCSHCDLQYFPASMGEQGFEIRCRDPHLYYQCKLASDDNRIDHYTTKEESCIIALFDDIDKGENTWYKYKDVPTETLLKKATNLEILDENIPPDDDEIFHWDVDGKTYVTTDIKKLPKHYFGGIIFRAIVVYLVALKENA